MAKTPLEDGVLDVAIFCLSLMGTNMLDFLKEAFRCLKPSGMLKIAEVESRFDNYSNFVQAVEEIGFKLKGKNTTNSHFTLFDFVKVAALTQVKNLKRKNEEVILLKACKYKKR